ncbi:hypothetical protein IC582_008338 [Cucumis melo]
MNEGGNALRSRPMGNYSYSFEIVHEEENEKERLRCPLRGLNSSTYWNLRRLLMFL